MAAGFPQTVFKAGAQTTKQTAAAIARTVADQSRETLKNAQDQIGIPRSEKLPTAEAPVEAAQPMAAMQHPQEEFIDRQAIAAKERAMLAQLESRLAQIRARQTQELTAYKEATQAKMDAQTHVSPVEAPQPQGKIRKAMGKAKKAITSLISNRKQGETKQGSGKG